MLKDGTGAIIDNFLIKGINVGFVVDSSTAKLATDNPTRISVFNIKIETRGEASDVRVKFKSSKTTIANFPPANVSSVTGSTTGWTSATWIKGYTTN